MSRVRYHLQGNAEGSTPRRILGILLEEKSGFPQASRKWKHNAATHHPIITSFEPGERWFYDYRSGEFFAGPALPAPHSHPLDQPTPGPAGRVPANWQTLLHE
jgi:hypothetical protein